MTFDHKSHIRILEEEVANYRNALDWISRRIPPYTSPGELLKPEWIREGDVRQVAHDVVSCARAVLEQNKAKT